MDIFGRDPQNYSYLQRIAANNMLDSHLAQLKARGRAHDFNALPLQHQPIPMIDTEAAAQALSFATNNFQAIQAQVEEILYTDFRLDGLFPMKTSGIPEGARTYSYKVINKYGLGKFIDNAGKTANSASVSLQNVPYGLEYGGIIPDWTLEDLRNAAFGGIALDTSTIEAGTTGCMDHIEQVGIEGDTTRSLTGLINDADIPTDTASKTIVNMSALEMVQFVQTGFKDLIIATEEVFGRVIRTGACLYVPISQADLLLNTNYAADANKTVWEYVKTNNTWTNYTGEQLTLKIVKELVTAGSGSTARALFGFNNERVMEMAMPIPPRVIRLLETAYGVQAPMEYKISGLNVKRASAMEYIDGI